MSTNEEIDDRIGTVADLLKIANDPANSPSNRTTAVQGAERIVNRISSDVLWDGK